MMRLDTLHRLRRSRRSFGLRGRGDRSPPTVSLLRTFRTTLRQVSDATRHWHLLEMTPDGRRLHELREVPRLLEVDGSSLYFVDPNAEAPNRWIEARLPR